MLKLAIDKLASEQVEQFRARGYTLSRHAFDAGAVAAFDRWARELVDAPEVSGRHWVYRDPSLLDPNQRIITRIERISPFHDGFRQLTQTLAPLVGQLLGEPARLFKEKINFKFPGADGFKPHQDAQAGWNNYADFFVSALVCFDEATAANGCLQIVENYEHKGLAKLWEPLSESDLAGMRWIDLPTQPGDIIFFDSYVPHASQPNMTDRMRRIYYATYNRASAGDLMERYYADKHKSFPPDIDRDPTKRYVFRV
ncbi:MAG TPA: phytanoyl-CoA dioxygenase family protein, partial [Hypericibacter adhaerens]|uniref:phytanoyl-CoA dioxygenase family protein n=1 Tax=Hypericibacter adhaerens TaxID=2602016 RepID=UPI002CA9DD4E